LQQEVNVIALDQISQEFPCPVLTDHGSRGDFDLHFLAIRSGPPLRPPANPILSPEMAAPPERGQAVEKGIHLEDDVPPSATIAAIRAATGNVLLSSKVHNPVPSFSGGDVDLGFVQEHGFSALRQEVDGRRDYTNGMTPITFESICTQCIDVLEFWLTADHPRGSLYGGNQCA
jgi:hypothetical protein